MSLRVTLNTNNSNIEADIVIIEASLVALEITQARRDELVNALDVLTVDNNTNLALLDNTMGAKRAGNFSTLEEVLDNKAKVKDETIKSLNKYSSSTSTSFLSKSSADLCLIDAYNIDYPIHINITDIETWFDNNYVNYLAYITSHSTLLNDIYTNIALMKNNVDTFIQDIRNLASNVSISFVTELSITQLEKDKFLCGKSVDDLAFIDEFNALSDKSSFLNDKISNILL